MVPSRTNDAQTSPCRDTEAAGAPVAPSAGTPASPTGGNDGPANGSEDLRRLGSRASRQSRNERRAAAAPSPEYDAPGVCDNLDDAFARPPRQEPDEEPLSHAATREDAYAATAAIGNRPRTRRRSLAGSELPAGATVEQRTGRCLSHSSANREARMARRRSVTRPVDYDVPDAFANLGELAVPPVENPDENPVYEHHSLEQARSQDHEYAREEQLQRQQSAILGRAAPALPLTPGEAEKAGDKYKPDHIHVSRLATQIYTLSYLIFFAIFGTLARLGLQALTNYPGTPVSFTSIWPNFAGSLVMGFLAEDRMLFRSEWGTPTYENLIREACKNREENGSGSNASAEAVIIDLAAAKRAHLATKKTIPLYIGLATGFCGSFTSFSAFIRDIFLALSNDMSSSNPSRNGGYSFMAVLAVIILTVSLSLAGLFVGAHLAIALEPLMPSLSYPFTRKILDRLVVLLGWGCWLGAILLTVLSPDRDGVSPETWRGRATFALVFAPLGCLGRFYFSLYLNGRIASFPLGTFVVNIFGTLVLGVSWDLAHVPLGGVVGCQVLQGVEDGFCGCLTTVSTWVAELSGLKRRNAYLYGTSSVLAGLAVLVAVMGGLKWSNGFSTLQCVH